MTFYKWIKNLTIQEHIKQEHIKPIITIILFIVITSCYFINIEVAISLILLLAIFSLLYQIIAPKYPLVSYKIFTYTVSIIMLLIVLTLENKSQIFKNCTICSPSDNKNSYNTTEFDIKTD